MMPLVRRLVQLLSQGPENLIWLIYTAGIATWVHYAAGPAHRLVRRYVRYRRKKEVEVRTEALRRRVAQGAWRTPENKHRVALATLNAELEKICRPLRCSQDEIPLADIDQDGLLFPRFSSLWHGAFTGA